MIKEQQYFRASETVDGTDDGSAHGAVLGTATEVVQLNICILI